jgi:membrane-associated phospholipid phosphatase
MAARRATLHSGYLLYLIPLSIFIVLAIMIASHRPPEFDYTITNYLGHHRSALFTSLMKVATDLGSTFTMIAAILALAIGLLPRRRHIELLLLSVGVIGAAALNFILKVSFQRARPTDWPHLVKESSFSFPSGHSMVSSGLAFAVIYLLWPTRWRYPAIVVGVAYIFLVGLSRVYLGVHFPSDVIAGWSASLLLVGFASHWLASNSRLVKRYDK